MDMPGLNIKQVKTMRSDHCSSTNDGRAVAALFLKAHRKFYMSDYIVFRL